MLSVNYRLLFSQHGLSQLATVFPTFPMTGVPVRVGLHLKSFLSMAGSDLIAIGGSPAAREAREVIESKGKYKYRFLETVDDIAANCLCVNGTLIHVTKKDFPNSFSAFETLPGKKIALSASELNKVDGCFTCCSVLIK